jgi:hypothetical protein
MGDGDSPDPHIGPGGGGSTDESESGDGDDSRQTNVEEHAPGQDPAPADPDDPDDPADDGGSGAPIGGGAPSGAGGAASGTGGPVPTPPEDTQPSDPDSGEGETEDEPTETDDGADTADGERPEDEIERDRDDEFDDDEQQDDDEEEDDDDDDDDDDEQQATVTHFGDAWDNVGFGLYPIYYQLKEEFGEQLQFNSRSVPVREFDEPDAMVQEWKSGSQRHQMPVNTSVWHSDPPASTEFSNRAIAAVERQSSSIAEDFRRRLRIAAIVEGRNIEDKDTLVEIATDLGADAERLHDAWGEVEVRESKTEVDTPQTKIEVDGETIQFVGYVHVDDIKMPLKQAGLEVQDPQPLSDFVAEYGPVATKEIQQVYDFDSQDTTVETLQARERIVPVEFGDQQFWDVE